MVKYNNRLGMQVVFKKGSLLRHSVYHAVLYSVFAAIIVVFDLYFFDIKVSITPWVIVGSALGLLLVFRTNTAYDRYWEGRKAIGGIYTILRSIATLLIVLTKDKQEKWTRLLGLFMFVFTNRLWGQESEELFEAYRESLTENQIVALNESINQPLSLVLIYKEMLNEHRCNKEIDSVTFIHLDTLVNGLIKATGICERIKKTPIPFPYHVHIKSLLISFCVTLPIALVDSMGWLSIFSCAFVTFAFVGIEEIGIEIEDPFGQDVNDFNLLVYAQNIREELEMLSEKKA